GPVVRLGPNRVSVASLGALKDIYGLGASKNKKFIKGGFYAKLGRRTSLFSERSPTRHAQMRKLLGGAFTPSSIKGHETLVRHHIDILFCQLECMRLRPDQHVMNGKNGMFLGDLLTCFALDVVGDLVLGESFNSLTECKPNPWAAQLPRMFYWAHFMELFDGTGIPTLFKWVFSTSTTQATNNHKQYSRDKVSKRLNTPYARKDIISEVLSSREAFHVTDNDLAAHFGGIIVAGGETTSTALSSMISFILTTPVVQKALQDELQINFNSMDEISAETTETLPYLNAVIQEGLRVYPPIAVGLPRISPGTFVDGVYIEKGVEIQTPIFALQHDPRYFHNPDEFRPERWLDCTDTLKASQPFSIGSRSCIGKHLALLQLRLVLAMFFWKYDAEYLGSLKDWREGKNYILWETPELWVELRLSKSTA
ncbi:putative cytochrome P450 monooxygenase, partial [Geopyxis carbonaria]